MFGIANHCPSGSAFTHAGTLPGGGSTETITEAFPLPVGPVQVRLNWVALRSAPVGSLPEVVLTPDQPPLAVHAVASVDDQFNVVGLPLVTLVGFAERVTVGPGGVTVTVAVALWVPPAPVQERLNTLLLVSAPVDSLPEVDFAPDQAPVATQDVAFVEFQLSVEGVPLVTVSGLAVSETVGTGGGGGVPATVTWTVALTDPAKPVQVSENVLFALTGPVDWLPDVAFVPDHEPDAAHVEVSVESQLSVDDSPLATEVGLALSDIVWVGRTSIPGGPLSTGGVSICVPHATSASTSAGTSSR